MGILSVFITNYISLTFGFLASISRPKFLLIRFIRFFIRIYGVNLSEVKDPISSFNSFSEFFLRDLKSNARVVEDGFVSPVDGTLRNFGVIKEGEIHQIKDMSLSLSELLHSESRTQFYENGLFFNLYLSPKDYHHVHMPFNGELESINYFSGVLWPVNDLFLKARPKLFIENKRAVFNFNSEFGKFSIVMIGALNVGEILTPWDLAISKQFGYKDYTKEFSEKMFFKKGMKIGSFNLGSSVMLLVGEEFVKKGRVVGEIGSVLYGRELICYL